jgi:hypothetical protein
MSTLSSKFTNRLKIAIENVLNKKAALKNQSGFQSIWLFGRRGVLLHLSGFPCLYRRRVDATKLSTSSNLFLSYINYTNFRMRCQERQISQKILPDRQIATLFCRIDIGIIHFGLKYRKKLYKNY